MRNPARIPAVTTNVHYPRICTFLALGAALALSPSRVSATSVVPPKFDSLVAQADYVVRAVIKNVTTEWRFDTGGRHIYTKVTLDVREVMKGNPPSPLVLDVLGGRIGKDELVVEGAPTFNVGDDDILFIHGNGRQFFPLVAIMYGQFLVQRDSATGIEFIHRSNGSPLYDVKDVVKPMSAATAAASTAAAPLTATQFSGMIRVSAGARVTPPPAHAN